MRIRFNQLYSYLYSRLRRLHLGLLSSNSYHGIRPKFVQPVVFNGRGRIVFNGQCAFGYAKSPMFYTTYCYLDARAATSEIVFEEGSIFNNNLSVIAGDGRIVLGKDLRIGRNCKIINSDFHNIDPQIRNKRPFPSADIIIEDNVFIGNDVTVLKGVTIGHNSTIGSGAIVVTDIPSNCVAVGVPARIVKAIK